MRVVILGTGGIGGYLAGRLGPLLEQQETALSSLSLVARGEHLTAIKERGLSFADPNGQEVLVHPTAASSSFAELAPADAVFLCMKGYDLDQAVDEIAPELGGETVVIPLLNGADIYERVRKRTDRGIVLPGAIYISSAVTRPGRVEHKGGKGLLVLGKGTAGDAVKPEQLLGMLEQAGIPFEWYEDPFPAIWSKYLFIAPLCLVTAATGKSLGEVLADRTLKADVRSMMEEVTALADAQGVRLPENAVEQTLGKAAAFPPETRTSFQRDIEAGRPRDEREIFGGTVVRMGRELGLPTPTVARYMDALP